MDRLNTSQSAGKTRTKVPAQLVEAGSHRDGQKTAAWDTGSVLGIVARLAGDDLTARIIRHLPDGYALLHGRAPLGRTA
ncbi:hypothetical protein [Streptomyces avermitilis]|uniref:hypothetical protein n=1 Tax=Streptomyces avermitilis TaxID=33903 RepID=UPI003F5293DE